MRKALPVSLILLASALHAAITPPPPNSTIVASPPVYGKITGAGLDCGGVCTSDQPMNNTVLTLTAEPAPGYMLDGWDGICAGQNNPCKVALSTSSASVGARFKEPYSLWDGSALAPGMRVAVRRGTAGYAFLAYDPTASCVAYGGAEQPRRDHRRTLCDRVTIRMRANGHQSGGRHLVAAPHFAPEVYQREGGEFLRVGFIHPMPDVLRHKSHGLPTVFVHRRSALLSVGEVCDRRSCVVQ